MAPEQIETRTATDGLTVTAIHGALTRIGRELDSLWLASSLEGRADALGLADASQAVHRALIALAPREEPGHDG